MSGELRDSGTGLSLDWILEKLGSTALELASESEMSCTSSWSSDLLTDRGQCEAELSWDPIKSCLWKC